MRPTPRHDYLVLSRGRWAPETTPEQVQTAIDAFYRWYQQGLADGRLKPGSRLATDSRLVGRERVLDGPFSEAREVIGGYWWIVADSLDAAAAIAAENPVIACGLEFEIRPLEAERADARRAANETPAASWLLTAAE
jgi:hypothetical protein